MTPLAKDSNGHTDWQFYFKLLIPIGFTLLLSMVPVVVTWGRLSAQLEHDRLLLHRLQSEVDGIQNRLDDHRATPGHSVMVERVDALAKEMRTDISDLEREIQKLRP